MPTLYLRPGRPPAAQARRVWIEKFDKFPRPFEIMLLADVVRHSMHFPETTHWPEGTSRPGKKPVPCLKHTLPCVYCQQPTLWPARDYGFAPALLWDKSRNRWDHIVAQFTPTAADTLPDGGHVGLQLELKRRGSAKGYLLVTVKPGKCAPPCPAFDIMPYLCEEWFPGSVDNPAIVDPEPVETTLRPVDAKPIQVPLKVFQEHSERHYKAYLELGDIPNAEKIAAEYLMRCGVKIPGWRDPVDIKIDGLLSTLVVLENETMGSPEKARARQMEIAVLLYQQGKLQAEHLTQVEKGQFNRATLTQAWNGEVIEAPAEEARPEVSEEPRTGPKTRHVISCRQQEGATVVRHTEASVENPDEPEGGEEPTPDNRLEQYVAKKQAEEEAREAARDQALSVVPFTRPSTNGHHKAKGGAR